MKVLRLACSREWFPHKERSFRDPIPFAEGYEFRYLGSDLFWRRQKVKCMSVQKMGITDVGE